MLKDVKLVYSVETKGVIKGQVFSNVLNSELPFSKFTPGLLLDSLVKDVSLVVLRYSSDEDDKYVYVDISFSYHTKTQVIRVTKEKESLIKIEDEDLSFTYNFILK